MSSENNEERTEFRTIPEMSTLDDDDFKDMTENSSAFHMEPANNGFLQVSPMLSALFEVNFLL